MYSFIEKCLSGDALTLEIDNYVDSWHESNSDSQLHEFLGMSKKEYSLYVEDEDHLDLIIAARKESKPLRVIYKKAIALAARSDDPEKSKRLERWLKDEELW